MIVFPVTKMNFISITEPSYGPMGDGEQYQVAVPVGELPEEIMNNMPNSVDYTARGKWGMFSIRTNRRPRVFGMNSGNSDLVDLLRHCEVTQTSLDMALRDQPGVICCSLFEKTTPRATDPYGVSLIAIRVDADKIPRPSWDDLISGRIPL